MWNVLYDGLLRNHLPARVSFLAFANDVALVTVARYSIALGNLLTTSAEIVHKWLLNIGIQLAVHKSEPLVLTNTRTYNDMAIHINGEKIVSGKTIKYLGLEIDAKLNFN